MTEEQPHEVTYSDLVRTLAVGILAAARMTAGDMAALGVDDAALSAALSRASDLLADHDRKVRAEKSCRGSDT